MKKFNLHTHSNHSLDAIPNINEIINMGFNNNINYISITDHDNCDAYLELDKSKIEKHGTLIYGMEADAVINNVTYDILCYGFNLEPVTIWAKEQYGTIGSRQVKIYEKLVELCNNLNLEFDHSIPYNPDKEFAHAAIYRMLESNSKNISFLNKYELNNVSDLYRRSTMDPNFPLYIDMTIVWPTIKELTKIIHENGGKTFLAHPYRYAKTDNVLNILNSCYKYVDGIEIYNNPKDFDEVKYLYNFAKSHNLLVSAGSDFHGNDKHNIIDVDILPTEMQEDIESWIKDINGKTFFYN